MGLIDSILNTLFGGGRNLLQETAGVFAENAEARAGREFDAQGRALAQHGAEFTPQRTGRFDLFMDGLNRLPRPALALGTVGLFAAAMTDPLWFAARMQGLTLVPEPLWWLLGVVVSFYFGARHQRKSLEFQRDIASTLARAPQVVTGIERIKALRWDSPGSAATGTDADLATDTIRPDVNAALDEWRKNRPATM